MAPAGGGSAAAARGCSGPQRCGRTRQGDPFMHPRTPGIEGMHSAENTSGSDAEGRFAKEGRGGCRGGASCCSAGFAEAPALAGGEEEDGPGAAPPLTGRDKGGPSGPPLDGAPLSSSQGGSAGGIGIVLVSPPGGWGDRGSAAPAPDSRCDITLGAPRLARLGVRCFVGREASCPGARGGCLPSTLGGAGHWRAAGGPESGRACEAGRACPSKEDNAAAPARRASGTNIWRPSATRGGNTGQLELPEGPVWPAWPARQQRLMLQPRLLQRAHDGAPCTKHSSPACHCLPPGGLGGSSCMVKITPNAPNLDQAKKWFFTGSVFF